VAEKLVKIHTSYFKIPTNRAKSFVVNLLTRKWGHSIARGWARLLLERLRGNVDLPADLKSFATNPDAIETEDEEEFANALLSHLNPQNLIYPRDVYGRERQHRRWRDIHTACATVSGR
jgi:hypothetical protein